MLCSMAEPCPLFRQRPIKQGNLILLGPILLKAISKLHRQKTSCSANLDSSEVQTSLRDSIELDVEVTALSFRAESEDQEQTKDDAHLEDGQRPLIAKMPAQGELDHHRGRGNQYPKLIDHSRK
jgi:hypothetical protein